MQTTDHLPVRRGFATHAGYLQGAENYVGGFNNGNLDGKMDMWHDGAPGAAIAPQIEYSTNWYSRRAVELIRNFSSAPPEQRRDRAADDQ